MNKILLFLFLAASFYYGCSSEKKDTSETGVSIEKESDNKKVGQVISPSDSAIIVLNLSEGQGFAQIRKKEDQTIYIQFESEGYKKISAKLSSPDSLANIRFSQIFLPDGTMDGPFGRDLEYDLSADGIYKISIHENMMAGDPWSGIFNVQVDLKK